MARQRRHQPLHVYQNERHVGVLQKEPNGGIQFRYSDAWLAAKNAIPVSLSLPLREDAYKGDAVIAVFDNLLPDADTIRRRVAERLGAEGVDAYSLLAVIGRDCVGALQFLHEGEPPPAIGPISGEPLDNEAIERLLNNLARAPLGLNRDDDFRISVAGAQEKTALLRHEGRWLKPHGATPTTHIFKTQIGRLPNGVDLADSVENEFFCLKLMDAFGLETAEVEIVDFNRTRALVIKRFDRAWTPDGRLMRLPQEDMCQALSVPPTQKYQSEGGPGMRNILRLLDASNASTADKHAFIKAQMLFWLMGATDGHAKNFSIRLHPGGVFYLTPFYDVVSAEGAFAAGQIERKQMRLAMAVGDNPHYRLHEIALRHFLQTVARTTVHAARAFEQIADGARVALEKAEAAMPSDYNGSLPGTIRTAFMKRLAGARAAVAN